MLYPKNSNFFSRVFCTLQSWLFCLHLFSGLCSTCALQLDQCPLCRGVINERMTVLPDEQLALAEEENRSSSSSVENQIADKLAAGRNGAVVITDENQNTASEQARQRHRSSSTTHIVQDSNNCNSVVRSADDTQLPGTAVLWMLCITMIHNYVHFASYIRCMALLKCWFNILRGIIFIFEWYRLISFFTWKTRLTW